MPPVLDPIESRRVADRRHSRLHWRAGAALNRNLRHESFATCDELPPHTHEADVTERIIANPEPCGCACDCVGIRTDDEPDELCLACRHGFHTEDE